MIHLLSVPMIICNDSDDINESPVIRLFSNKEAAGFYEWCDWSAEKGLERLVFQVSSKPKCLTAHVERIYYCFHSYFDEQLFAALVDLLFVLNRYGQALSLRMINGSRARLTENQFQILVNYLKNKSSGIDPLPSSRYSVFTKGLQSTTTLVQLTEGLGENEHDPLTLARDYIEFSQLENSINILEQAILAQPERMELHYELLSIYRSIRNETEFNRIYEELSRKKISLPAEWNQLNDFIKVEE